MIEVVHPELVEMEVVYVTCDFCGARSSMRLETIQIGAEILYNVDLAVCCEVVEARAAANEFIGGLPN